MSNQPTPAAEWREAREAGYVVTLPSGKAARLRPVALDVMISRGQLPDLLTPIAAKTLWSETDTGAIADEATLAQGFTELVALVCVASFLEPRIVDAQPGSMAPGDGELTDNEIRLEDIDFQDKVAVFQAAIQPAEVLKRFRDQQEAGVAALPHGAGDRPTTE